MLKKKNLTKKVENTLIIIIIIFQNIAKKKIMTEFHLILSFLMFMSISYDLRIETIILLDQKGRLES